MTRPGPCGHHICYCRCLMGGLYRWQYDADTPGTLIGHQWHVRPSHWLNQTQSTLWCKWLVITTNNDLNFLCHHKSFRFRQIVFNSRQFSPQIFPTLVRTRGIVGRGEICTWTFQIISYLESHNPSSSRDIIITSLYCRSVAMSQLYGSPRLEGDSLQVSVYPGHWRPEV